MDGGADGSVHGLRDLGRYFGGGHGRPGKQGGGDEDGETHFGYELEHGGVSSFCAKNRMQRAGLPGAARAAMWKALSKGLRGTVRQLLQRIAEIRENANLVTTDFLRGPQ